MSIQVVLLTLGVLASVFLGAISNWIYDLLKERGLFPDRPTVKRVVIIMLVSVPFITFVALAGAYDRDEMTLLELLTTAVPLWLVLLILLLALAGGYLLGRQSGFAKAIIYDSRRKCTPYHFEGAEGRLWDTVKQTHTGPTGRGSLKVKRNGVLLVERINTEGRFEIRLQRYFYKKREREYLPKNDDIVGKRKLRVTCQAKASGAKHTLKFSIKNKDTGSIPTSKEMPDIGNEWTGFEHVFSFSPSIDCWLRIDDIDVSKAPSSIQIRCLRLAEEA